VKTFEAWPFKQVLEDRIAQADENVVLFRKVLDDRTAHADPKGQLVEKTRTMMISSAFACMACHQQ